MFVNIGNNSAGTVVNTLERDMSDGMHDGIADVGVAINNATLSVSEKFQACVVLFSNLNLTCVTGNNSPSGRYEYVQVPLDNQGK